MRSVLSSSRLEVITKKSLCGGRRDHSPQPFCLHGFGRVRVRKPLCLEFHSDDAAEMQVAANHASNKICIIAQNPALRNPPLSLLTWLRI